MSDELISQSMPPSDIAMLRTEMREGFQSVAKRFDHGEGRLDQVDGRLDKFEGRVDKVDGRLVKIDGRLDKIDGRLDGHDTRFESLDKRITDEAEATRRRFDVVAEDLRQSFKGVIDQ